MKHSFLQAGLLGLLCTLAWPAWAGFTDNNDGTITDTTTGLVWDKCSRGQTWSPGTCTGTASTHTWAAALSEATAANTASHRGHTDWRLPNVTEQESLVKMTAVNPAIEGAAFPNTPWNWFWSSTTYAPGPADAWVVDFGNGGTNAYRKTFTFHVRLVRSGQWFGALDALDVTAPVLASLAVANTTATATTLQATSNEAVTGYWVALPQASAAPSAAQVRAGQDSGGNVVALKGNGAMAAGTQKDFAVTGLAQSTTYTLYLVAEDGWSNLSTVSATNVTTLTPVNGACGSANNVATLVAPAANLCSAGVDGSVSSAATAFTWNCAGTGGGTTSMCSAPRQYSVTPAPGANGSMSPGGAQAITYNFTRIFSVTPNVGYAIGTVSGCGVVPTGNNTYTTGAVVADCTVTASFVPLTYAITATASPTAGGSVSCAASSVAHGGGTTCTASAPNAGFIFSGFTGCDSVSSNVCTLSNVTAARSVVANFTADTSFSGTTVPGAGGTAGAASASFTGGGASCAFDGANTGFVAAPATLPAGQTMPQGMFQFRLVGCTPGATVAMSVTWPQAVQGLTKWGKATSGAASNTHFAPNNLAVTGGNTTTFTVTDGQKGDDDWAQNGTIVDPVGPVMAAGPGPGPGPGGPQAIPTLGEWSLALLSLLAAAMGMGALRRRGVQQV